MINYRILKISYNPPDFFNLGYDNIFKKVRRVIILNTLMQNFDKFLFMVEIDWVKKPDNEFVKQFSFIEDSVELMVSKNRSICLISSKLPEEYSEILSQLTSNFNCFLEFPVVLEDTVISGNIVGGHKDIQRFLDFIENWGLEFKIISIKKYYPKSFGVLSALSMQQLKCLEFAVENGYFDFPKRSDARTIANKLKISHSTFVEHIKKAEKTIFSNLFRV